MGVSILTLKKLKVDTIKGLYDLTVDDIKKLDGFGNKKSNSIVNELKDKLEMSQEKFLSAMGVSGLGNETATSILKKISFDDLFKTDDFSFIDGIGDITNRKILLSLDMIEDNYKLLLKYGLKWKEKDLNEFSGKIFTLTGSAPIKRDDLITILENKGCSVKNISKKVNFLVTDDIDSNSSKAKKARKYGITFMSYDELLEKLNIVE